MKIGGNLSAVVVSQQTSAERIRPVADTGMNGQARRLVCHQQIVILIEQADRTR